MIRLFSFLFLMMLSVAASAQVTGSSATTTSAPSLSASTAAETRARDEAFAAWKVRYATNRAWIADEIKAVRQELNKLRQAQPEPGQRLTDLLNGTIKRWNQEKTDYGDAEQFADCQEFFATLRTSIQNERTKK
ncbi:hypothetical protein [Spirosoma sordidisoli]|uniref:Uncharacterized protein n=1 Tax=Spirosoma sordidisoli TaxID=2502893 RepID=A0A4Q2UMZ7_9BACT|nr:hypothetical protein [Spirosoma sordidisoli]RYC70172.1 hypothetical protein EQG79_09910 [Spirosoma sordidisoli]